MGKSIGIVGSIVNKVGNLVFSTWKGIQVVKVYQPNVVNPRSAGQIAQRTRFNSVVDYAVAMSRLDALKSLWADITPQRQTAFSYFTSINLLNGNFVDAPPGFENHLPSCGMVIDYHNDNVLGLDAHASNCSSGSFTGITYSNLSGCGMPSNACLIVHVYNSSHLVDPDSSPFRGVRMCEDYYLTADLPTSISNVYDSYDQCPTTCPDPCVITPFNVFVIPLYMTNPGSSGTFPGIAEVAGVGIPARLCVVPV